MAKTKLDGASAPACHAPMYTKAQILKSSWYSHRRSVLAALLEDDKTYSFADVDKLLTHGAKRVKTENLNDDKANVQ